MWLNFELGSDEKVNFLSYIAVGKQLQTSGQSLTHQSCLVSSRDSSSKLLFAHYLKYLDTKTKFSSQIAFLPMGSTTAALVKLFLSVTISPVYSLHVHVTALNISGAFDSVRHSSLDS